MVEQTTCPPARNKWAVNSVVFDAGRVANFPDQTGAAFRDWQPQEQTSQWLDKPTFYLLTISNRSKLIQESYRDHSPFPIPQLTTRQ